MARKTRYAVFEMRMERVRIGGKHGPVEWVLSWRRRMDSPWEWTRLETD